MENKEFYTLSQDETLSELASGSEGLESREVEVRQKNFGKNTITLEHERSFLSLFLLQFRNYLAWLLIFVAGFAFFAGFYLKQNEQVIDGVIISIIILANALIGAFQDFKAERAASLLKSMLKTEALVLRDGKKQKVDAVELVPGDIIFLEEGDKVPADCRLLEAKELRIDESMLTGESKHVLKNAEVIKEKVPLAERKNLLFMNTYVSNGSASAVVIETGKNTEVGKIAKSLEIEETSPFVEEVDAASKKITLVALALIIAVLGIYFLKDHHWVAILMIGSALIIGSIPEGLPAIVTFSLSIASLKLAKSNVLVKRKSLLETLGGVDVICTDKTGTLTENRMVVKRLFFDMKDDSSLDVLSEKTLDGFVHSALLANEVKDTDKGFQGNPEDVALVTFLKEKADILELRKSCETKHFEPFSSEKKYVSSENLVDNKTVLYVKGAPEIILGRCESILVDGHVKKLDDSQRDEISKKLKEFSDASLRNIAFSYKIVSEGDKENNEVFLGFVGIYDKPKDGVVQTVEIIYSAGIEIKMITGDNVHTATAIAKECGFRNVQAVSWDDVKDLSDEELKGVVEKCNVFARMSPEFKLKIVSALQMNGRRVAITGDGVNDVPALKQAEVGIAMGLRGTDIAKEAADLILLDDNLSSLEAALKEGRTIFSNIRKVINYLLTANLAEVFVVFLGSMFGVMPFLAIQLLWVNFVTDIAPALSLGADASHKNIMSKKPTGKQEKLINKKIALLTVFIGIKKVILMFSMFYIVYKVTDDLVLAQTMSFTWLVMSHFVRIAAIRFDEGRSLFYNKYVNWSIAIPIVFQLVILYTPLADFFQVVPLSLVHWGIIVATVILAVGLAKIITYFIDRSLPASERDY